NNGVDVATFGGHIRVCKTFAEVVDFLAADFIAVSFGGAVDFTTVHDIHSAFGTHHGDFRSGPSVIDVRANMFGSHHTIRAAVSLASDYGDFRHGGFGEGEKQFRAVLDDSAELLLRAG